MRVLGLDFETTGFDTANDRITEIGFVIWETDTGTPLRLMNELVFEPSMLERFTPETVAMMKRVCGLTPEMLKEFGVAPQHALTYLDEECAEHGVEYIVAHNGANYDRPLLVTELDRHKLDSPTLRSIPWIDTRTDLPFDEEPDSRKLKHLAGDHGFLNPFAHRAVFDVLTMLRVLGNYDIAKVIEYAKQPSVVMRAMVGYDERDKAKAQRYSWEKLGDKSFTKCWVKLVKEGQKEKEIESCKTAGFKIVQIA